MEKAFEKIALIDSVLAAALANDKGELRGWCANSAISAQRLTYVAISCHEIFQKMDKEGYASEALVANFGDMSLLGWFYQGDVFILFLHSPVTEALQRWLWEQIHPLLAAADAASL